MAISVDTVYKKVLAILNKESRGFLTPDEFQRIGSQIQLDLLDKAFHDYNRAVARDSMGRGGQGYADIPKKIQDRIDPFYATSSVTLTSGVGTLPTFYNIISVSTTICSTMTDIERVEKAKLSFLLSSPLTTPSTTFPIYYVTGTTLTVNPSTIASVDVNYVSVPTSPVWNYTTDDNGAFTYTATGSTDFGLHPSSEVDLILGILRYAGVIIKDPSVIQTIGQETATKTQQENI
tara:strand:- start:9 stop:710 length:702 start_codon:yes stop_codon:yes gene_type:complete